MLKPANILVLISTFAMVMDTKQTVRDRVVSSCTYCWDWVFYGNYVSNADVVTGEMEGEVFQ